MKREFILTFLFMLIGSLLAACAPLPIQGTLTSSPTPLTDINQPGTATPIHQPARIQTPIRTNGGPFLLLQSSVDGYSLINFTDLSITPFDPPGPDRENNLTENLSPGKTQMLFQIRREEVGIYSFITDQIHTTYHLESDGNIFQTKIAVQDARKSLPDLKYSDEALLMAVKNAFLQSISTIQWFQSDRYRLTVLPSGETSTQLTLDDHQTGMRMALEDQPALVESFWPGPEGEKILLKKSFIFEPGIWQDDRYYLVDVRGQQAAPMPLPDDADNPGVFWFDSNTIGIIHHPAPAGGRNFSLVDIDSLSIELVVSGHFDGLRRFGTGVLTIHQDTEAEITTLNLWDLEGQRIDTQSLEGLCVFSASLSGDRLLMNCGLEGLLVTAQDQNLALSPFGEAVFLMSPTPDEEAFILVTQGSAVKLLDSVLKEIESLTLEAPPLEIRWLPDSSGFLYRTPRSLYLYEIQSKTNTFLIESDLFGDYRNLNAVWIHLSE